MMNKTNKTNKIKNIFFRELENLLNANELDLVEKQKSEDNWRIFVVLICFLGDLINSIYIYLELRNFHVLKEVLFLYSEHLPQYGDVLNAPEFQIQIYQLLIKSTVTTLGLFIFFHAIVYYFFLIKKKFTHHYLMILTFVAGVSTIWFGIRQIFLAPMKSIIIIQGCLYLLAFFILLKLKNNHNEHNDHNLSIT